MRIGTRVTISYVAMTLAGIVLMILPEIYLNLSLDLIAINSSTIIFMIGDAVSILGLHEVCHCLYCKIKCIEIVEGIRGLRNLGIKVKREYQQEVRLSSLFSIPITVTASALFLPLWIFAFNTLLTCIYCTDDIRRFLRDRVDRSLDK